MRILFSHSLHKTFWLKEFSVRTFIQFLELFRMMSVTGLMFAACCLEITNPRKKHMTKCMTKTYVE